MQIQKKQALKVVALAALSMVGVAMEAPLATAFIQAPPVTIDTSQPNPATILNTSSLWASPPTTYHACVATSLAASTVPITIEMIDSNGGVIATTGQNPVSIAAGGLTELVEKTFFGFARCRFTIYVIPDKVRANMSVFKQDSVYETLANSEAR